MSARPRLERSLSAELAWDDLIAHEAAVETVAEAFCVVRLPEMEPLQPLDPVGMDEPVLANLCLVGTAETKPEGFEVLTDTLCGHKAVVSSSGGAVYLAQRVRPLRQCSRPITAICIVDTERGATAPADFEPVERTADAERAAFSRTLWVSRTVADPRDTSSTAAPLAGVAVLTRHGAGSQAPAGFERLDGALGAARAERLLAVRRARPCGLLQTPLCAAIVDSVLRRDRPQPSKPPAIAALEAAAAMAAPGNVSGGGGDEDGGESSGAGGGDGATATATHELPSALPHFCLPQGAQLRLECPWPTAHDFALTGSDGARLYGCCLTVWEPLAQRALLCLRPHSVDERLRLERRLAAGEQRAPPLAASWDAVRDEWTCVGDRTVADEALRAAFSAERRVVLASLSRTESDAGAGTAAADSAGDAAAEAAAAEAAAAARLAAAADAAETVLAVAETADGSGRSTDTVSERASERASERGRSDSSSSSAAGASQRPLRRRQLTQLAVDGTELYAPTCLCVLTRHPFLCSLRAWLCELYRHSLSRAAVPIERLLCSLLWECPLPRATVTVSFALGREEVLFERSRPDTYLPVHELRLASLMHALPPHAVLKLFAAACAHNDSTARRTLHASRRRPPHATSAHHRRQLPAAAHRPPPTSAVVLHRRRAEDRPRLELRVATHLGSRGPAGAAVAGRVAQCVHPAAAGLAARRARLAGALLARPLSRQLR
jgi:hypothetical protein